MRHLRSTLVCILILFFQVEGYTYDKDSVLTALIDQEFALGSQYLYSDFDSAILHLNKVIEVSDRSDFYVTAVTCSIWKLNCASHHFRMAELQSFLKEADQLYLAAESELDSLGMKNDIYLNILVHWGNYHYKLGNYEKANRYFDQTIDALVDKTPLSFLDYNYLASTHIYKGTIHKKRGNYQMAIDNFLQVLHYSEECLKTHKKPTQTSIVIKHLAETYQLKGDYENAQNYYEKGINYYKNRKKASSNSLINYYNAFAKFYIENTQYDSALYYLDESLNIQLEKDPFFSDTYLLIGEVHRELNDQNKAKSYFEKAHNAAIGIYGENHYKVATINLAHGKSFEKQLDWDTALTYYDRAIQNLLPGYLVNKKHVAPKIERLYAPKELVAAFSNKSNVLFKRYQEIKDPTILEKSYQFAQRSMDVIDSLRLDYDAESSRQFLVNKSYPIFEQAMAICYQLYTDQNDPKYLEEAFRIAEKSKGVLLLDALANSKAEEFAGIPDALLEKGRQIKYKVKKLEDKLRREQAKNTAVNQISETRNQLFGLKQQYQAYIKKLETEHPKYYQLKYDLSTITTAALKKDLLDNNQTTLIEYFLGDEHIYAFTISKEQTDLVRLPADFPLKNWIRQLRGGITGTNPQRAAIDYTTSAYQIYQKLLAPLSLTPNLIIIPDGVLGYVPFDALLKAVVPDNQVRQYSEHPYLLKEHNVAYCFSATLLREMKQKQTTATRSFLGFAPTFTSYSPLDASSKRTEDLATIYKGDFLSGTAATKSKFEKEAGHYEIVHISSHAVANDSLQDACFLVCSEIGNSEEHLLYNRDLYQLNLNASLVVLGACETGSGQLQRGEGIISLARGFSYAGANSLLTTLWSVDEASTANLLGAFYENLGNGLATDESLVQAKRAYLANADNEKLANPRYWAALIPIGDMAAINDGSANLGLLGWALAVGFLLLGFGYFMKRRTT